MEEPLRVPPAGSLLSASAAVGAAAAVGVAGAGEQGVAVTVFVVGFRQMWKS